MTSQYSLAEGEEELSILRRDLASLLNRYSREGGSNTPDMILADYLTDCLMSFDRSVRARERWYGITSEPGEGTRKMEA